MPPVSVAGLARDGRIEVVSADLNAAGSRVEEAKTDLASSAALAETERRSENANAAAKINFADFIYGPLEQTRGS